MGKGEINGESTSGRIAPAFRGNSKAGKGRTGERGRCCAIKKGAQQKQSDKSRVVTKMKAGRKRMKKARRRWTFIIFRLYAFLLSLLDFLVSIFMC